MPKNMVYGNKDAYYAPITNTGSAAFGAPVRDYGLVSTSITNEQTNTQIRADDSTYFTVSGARSITAEITKLSVDEDFAAAHLGFKKMANGMIVDTGVKQPFAYYWVETVMQEDNTTTQMLTILYNCMATEGDVESNTLEDEVEAKEMTLNLTCTPSSIATDASSGGNGVTMARIIRTAENATWFDTYKTKVLLPTDSAGE